MLQLQDRSDRQTNHRLADPAVTRLALEATMAEVQCQTLQLMPEKQTLTGCSACDSGIETLKPGIGSDKGHAFRQNFIPCCAL